MENYYLILGLKENADSSEIKSAYRDRCKTSHPDTSACNGEEFRNIHDAYEVLSDPVRRREYDRELSSYRNRKKTSRHEEETIPIRRGRPTPEAGRRFVFRRNFFEDDFFSRLPPLFEKFFSAAGIPFSHHIDSRDMNIPSSGDFSREDLSCQLILSTKEALQGGTYAISLPTRPKRKTRIEIPGGVQGGEEFHFHLQGTGSGELLLRVRIFVKDK